MPPPLLLKVCLKLVQIDKQVGSSHNILYHWSCASTNTPVLLIRISLTCTVQSSAMYQLSVIATHTVEVRALISSSHSLLRCYDILDMQIEQ